MPKVWTDDTALMEGMTDNLFEALYKMPKYFLRIDDIAHSLGMPISSLLVLCVLYAVRQAVRPLENLAAAADTLDPSRPGPPLDEEGPSEVAHAAAAFSGD